MVRVGDVYYSEKFWTHRDKFWTFTVTHVTSERVTGFLKNGSLAEFCPSYTGKRVNKYKAWKLIKRGYVLKLTLRRASEPYG